MDASDLRRFVTGTEPIVELTRFTRNEWLSRPDLVPCRELLLVRATMQPGKSHPFHRHPHREEIIYVLSGMAEQWCGDRCRILKPGDMVLIPKDEVHGTYNPFDTEVVFLAILGPAQADGPDVIDVDHEPPWKDLRQRNPFSESR
ncbi:MAG: cupin domain-containing protein [Verrucomicrobiota bacterium]